MSRPKIEPGSIAWKETMLTTTPAALACYVAGATPLRDRATAPHLPPKEQQDLICKVEMRFVVQPPEWRNWQRARLISGRLGVRASPREQF